MKYSLIAAFVVLALAQGSLAAEVTELEKMTNFFEDMKNKMMATAQELTDTLRNQELATQAQSFLEDGRSQLEPLATKIQEQLQPLAANVQEQISPLTANVQEQLRPLVEDFKAKMDDVIRILMEQAKAIAN